MAGGRYAPSPTGRLHLGNLRTALLAWLQARLCGIPFIVRIDDLDTPRNRPQSLPQILADLQKTGLDWDEGPGDNGPNAPYLQSMRQQHYLAAFEKLQQQNLVYPCICSRKDVAEALSAPQNNHSGVYPGTCRPHKDAPPVDQHREPVAWRYQVNGCIKFNDRILGQQSQNLAADVGDFIVRRKDKLFAYQLASVVDDGLMAISDVVRGEDLAHSTPRQLALFQSLNIKPPNFWHVPLVKDATGKRMAKRDDSVSLDEWCGSGKTINQLIGHFAAELGLAPQGTVISAEELLRSIDLTQFTAALQNRSQFKI